MLQCSFKTEDSLLPFLFSHPTLPLSQLFVCLSRKVKLFSSFAFAFRFVRNLVKVPEKGSLFTPEQITGKVNGPTHTVEQNMSDFVMFHKTQYTEIRHVSQKQEY